MTKFYTGIGSRKTPVFVCGIMTRIARDLFKKQYTLRSGGAQGADIAFERGAMHLKEIYLPWHGFNGSQSLMPLPSPEAFALAEKYHPAWDKCSEAAKQLHARNGHQILGQDLNTPSEFVICWTEAAKDSGGTGQAIRIARDQGIPVYNLADPEVLKTYLKDLSM